MAPIPNIVIIGGSHAGLAVAQAYLNTSSAGTVTVISVSKDYYFNFAAARLLARPSEVPIDKLLIPIEGLFKKYPASRFKLVHATATSIDTDEKTVSTDSTKPIKYDYLVIASGSHTESVVADPSIPTKQTLSGDLRESIPIAQKVIADAKRIVVGGGGPVGIEMAGEIADAYPDKTVTLVAAGSRLLESSVKESVSANAANLLKQLKVKVMMDIKVESTTFDPAKKEWVVNLSNGSKLEADLYISAIGIIPNNSFVPPQFLSESGWVKVDKNLAVVGISSVYAAGDIAEGYGKSGAIAKPHAETVVKNIESEVSGGAPKPFKQPGISAMIVPIGKAGAVGQINSFVLWNWMASMIKGDFFISKTNMVVTAK